MPLWKTSWLPWPVRANHWGEIHYLFITLFIYYIIYLLHYLFIYLFILFIYIIIYSLFIYLFIYLLFIYYIIIYYIINLLHIDGANI